MNIGRIQISVHLYIITRKTRQPFILTLIIVNGMLQTILIRQAVRKLEVSASACLYRNPAGLTFSQIRCLTVT